jgi:hypothetical protein
MQQLLFKNYLTFIKNSVGTKLFQNFYILENENEKDVLAGGEISCAIFVSNILHMFPSLNLIKSPHLTISSTIKDMQSCGWYEINNLKVGAIILWEGAVFENTGLHKHIGFYIGDDRAISNSDKIKTPTEHDLNFDKTRKIEKIFWNDNLKNQFIISSVG